MSVCYSVSPRSNVDLGTEGYRTDVGSMGRTRRTLRVTEIFGSQSTTLFDCKTFKTQNGNKTNIIQYCSSLWVPERGLTPFSPY